MVTLKRVDEPFRAEYTGWAKKLGIVETPIVDMSFLSQNPQMRILAKDESAQVTGSYKSIPALAILLQSIKSHGITPIVDASSGNYAVAMAYFAPKMRFNDITLFIPEKFAESFSNYLRDKGINPNSIKVFSKGIQNSDDARTEAAIYAQNHPETRLLDQYASLLNPESHYNFTAGEIISQLGIAHAPTHFISCIGSGGALIGVGTRLKDEYKTKVIGIQLTKKTIPGATRDLSNQLTLPGICSDLKSNIDSLMDINTDEVLAFEKMMLLNPDHPLSSYGGSSFVNVYAAYQLSKEIEGTGTILTVIPGMRRENEQH
ncbi:MAG: pyridoxal-phosphate dependent enzyme [Candidatus Woesearchaeota archaeon]|nr:pyridoxal-phosphate dependent enzyme [Candidatus Woesearchaeota archaeon]